LRIGCFLSSEQSDRRTTPRVSPFVWATIGDIAEAAPGTHVTTTVTCPTMRIHPAVVAEGAATAAGFDAPYVNHTGPEQDAFFTTYREHVLPRVR
jgi:hypothetical protein